MIAFVLGLVQAALMFVAFGAPAWWPVAFFVPMPAIWLAMRTEVNWKRALLFAAGTSPFWAVRHAFIGEITAAGIVPLTIYLSLFPGVVVWAVSRATRHRWAKGRWWVCAAAAGLVWVGVDMVRGEVIFSGYAWYLAGEPLIEFYPAAAAGAAVGLYGVGLLVVLIAASVVQGAVRRSWQPIIGVVCAAAGWAGLSAIGWRDESWGVECRVAVVQTNVPQSNKLAWSAGKADADFARLLDLTSAAGGTKPDLIVWPETMKPGWVLTDAQIAETRALLAEHPSLRGLEDEITRAEMVREAARAVGTPMLVGQETMAGLRFVKIDGRWRDRYRARYNSSYLVGKGGEVSADRYDKMEPTPFGETIPYASGWPWLRDQLLDLAAGGMRVDLASGTTPARFTIVQRGQPADSDTVVRVVTPICFESTDTDHVRGLVGDSLNVRRADLIACMTNDGWFGGQVSGRESHLRLGRWRCVELGTPMARAANTGLSALIDARGRFVEPDAMAAATLGKDAVPPLTFDRDGVIVGTLRTGGAESVYGMLGNLVGWGCFAGLAAMAGWSGTRNGWGWLKGRKTRAGRTPQGV